MPEPCQGGWVVVVVGGDAMHVNKDGSSFGGTLLEMEHV